MKILVFLLVLWPLVGATQELQWESTDLPYPATLKGIFSGNADFVAYGDSGVVFASPDGRQWQDVSPPTSGNFTTGLAWQGLWVLAGSDAGIWVSQNRGQSWQNATLPEADDVLLQPGSLAIYDDQLLIFGRLEEQAHGCLSQFARSDDGLSWSIDNRVLPNAPPSNVQAVPNGLVMKHPIGGPICGVMPIVPGTSVDFFVEDDAIGFVVENSTTYAPPTQFRPGFIWDGQALWMVGSNLVAIPGTLPLEFERVNWVKRGSYADFSADHQQFQLEMFPDSLARMGNRMIVSHFGHVSIVDESGGVILQSLPVDDEIFVFAERDDLVVGVVATDNSSESMTAIRGSSLASVRVPINSPYLLWPLFFLLLGLAWIQLRSKEDTGR